MAQKTIFHDRHKALGGRIIDFHGWLMPVSFETPLKEHEHVRTACGIFDVSHMGEVFVSGPDATAYLDYMTINDVSRLAVGGGQYSAFLNEAGDSSMI
jgi:aminomethyltransferase